MSRQPTFWITAPTRAARGEFANGKTVELAVGTRLRYIRLGGLSDPCSDIYYDWHELEVRDGEWAGEVIVVADAGTPDEPGRPDWAGPRPRLGPPASFQPEEPLPADWDWLPRERWAAPPESTVNGSLPARRSR
jgi:hypothetical protein